MTTPGEPLAETTPPAHVTGGGESTTQSPRGLRLARAAILVAVFALSIGVIALGDRIETLANYGYFGMFAFNILTSATIILPAPALVVVFSMGAVLNPFWVGIAAALGSVVGELSGYGAGFSGQAVIENVPVYDRIVDWTQRYGVLPVVILSFIPNPIFDLAGIAAGALKMPLWKFMLAALAGKIPKMLIVAYGGLLSVDWFLRLFR